MLRKEVRLVVFLSCLVLFLILIYQSNIRQPSQNTINLRVDFANTDRERILIHHKLGKVRPKEYGSLSDDVIHGVKRFIFFAGYSQNGHNLVASMLDAHPHVIISHEYLLFEKWQVHPTEHSDKHWLFNTLYSKNRLLTDTKGSIRNLIIPGSWQGQYDTFLSIIGDNSGWPTVEVFKRNKEKFIDVYNQLKRTVQVPIDVIHVIRNPYDDIATMFLHKRNATYDGNKQDSTEAQILRFFEEVNSVVEMITTVHLSTIEVHNIDMITKPKITMRILCDRLRILCSEQLLQMCTHKIFSSEYKSRRLIKWTPHLIELVAKNIQKYDHLKRYSFTS